MSNRKYDVYGIGNALVDYEIEVTDNFLEEHSIEKGLMTLVEADQQRTLVEAVQGKIKKKQSGGSAANSMIALAQLGGKGYYTCKVANDEDGRLYKSEMSELGVDTNLDGLPEGTTGKCLVMVTPDSQRTMNTHLGITADLSEGQLNEDAIADAEYIYIEGYLVSSPTGIEAIKKAKALARKHGTKVAYTFSDPAMVKFFNDQSHEAVSGGLDMLFANDQEAQLFTGTDNDEDAFEALKEVARQFVMTRSEKGAWAWDGNKMIEIAPNKITPVDSTGAGDMFAGAYLYGITNGLDHQKAGDLASLLSAKVVAQFGPRLDHQQTKDLRDSLN